VTAGQGEKAETPGGRDAVLARLAPRWSATRTEDNLAVTFRRLERSRRARRLGAAGLGVAAVVALAATGLRPGPARVGSPAAPVATPAPRRLELPGGATVALGGPSARARVTRQAGARVEVELAGGPASFEIPRRKAGAVVVTVARVEVAILAAKFDVEPAGERVRVRVRDGEVAVSWPGAAAPARVRAGAAAVFPPEAPPVAEPPRARVAPEPPARFRSQVARHDWAGAYRSLEAAPGVADRSAEDLMLAADAARLSGHPASAVAYLARVVRDFPADVRAPVAAFTQGRVLLSELARPSEAADAFATSYRLAPSGALAADALGREAEAAARAGDAARARRVAAVYLARFPDGPRAAAVRRAAGLE
jgi:transmembrane sensor